MFDLLASPIGAFGVMCLAFAATVVTVLTILYRTGRPW